MSLAIQLPPREDQVEFNLRVWERVLADPALAKLDGHIETNRHGHIVMNPSSLCPDFPVVIDP